MHKGILTTDQVSLLPLVKLFSKDFVLVGGTAIALQMGHRQSIDFDLFTFQDFDNLSIRKKILSHCKIDQTIRDESGQYTVILQAVRFTFLSYPFRIPVLKKFEKIIRLPDLETLAAMKAYALGRRAKWKDYVDLYFILKYHCHMSKIVKKSKKIFGSEFNEKNFRVQLSYFDDIDYSEEVIFIKGSQVDDHIIREKLIQYSLA